MRDQSLMQDSYAVLLPAFENVEFTADSRSFFLNGGVASLLGCSREEYLARRMSKERSLAETAETFRDYHRKATAIAGSVLIAVDYEIGGVHRLHGLAPQIAHPTSAAQMTDSELMAFGQSAGNAARAMGINYFLAPVIDVVTGSNPWLLDRCISTDSNVVARCATAFIRGVQSAGIAATAKHFPGHHVTVVDPHDSETITVPGTMADLEPGLEPYRAAITAGVKSIMTGPVPVDAIDPTEPSSCSRIVVDMLRKNFLFQGLIVSDDIDLPGTMRGRSLEEIAIKGIDAGIDLLLLAAGPQVDKVAAALVTAVEDGRLDRAKLAASALAVRRLANDVAIRDIKK
jgi:beta-N-acetylhexosaminidase